MLGHNPLGASALGEGGGSKFAPHMVPAFVVAAFASVTVSANLAAEFAPAFHVEITGDGGGHFYIIPHDVEGGHGYLVEIDAWDKIADTATTLYFADFAFTTTPADSLPNTHFLQRLKSPGNYDRALFGTGTTSGRISVGSGYIELVANDGALDNLRPAHLAFDGYEMTIKTVERLRPNYDDAVTVFRGTVEQVEMTWEKASIRLRDRLATLDVEHQDDVFAGTTVAGGMDEAEGTADDLKDRPKPLAYGAPGLVPMVEANRFDHIYAAGNDGLAAIEDVRDRGVALTPTGNNYATVALLRAASIPSGQYSTCNALGLIRTGSPADGQITARPVEKSSAADRTAAQVARRILERRGLVADQHFLLEDIDALDALNPAPVGYWTGTDEQTTLAVAERVLGSIGATIMPDRLGVFRLMRLDTPSGYPPLTLIDADVLEVAGGRGVQRLATGDDGAGVPAWRVTVRYGYNWHVMRREDLEPGAVASDPAFAAFASQEWRNAVAEDAAVKAVHRLASDLVYETYLTDETDAQAEAVRLLAMHSVARDRFKVPVKTYMAEQVELGWVVRLKLSRFGLDAGKDFRVIGIEENFRTRVTTLDLWG